MSICCKNFLTRAISVTSFAILVMIFQEKAAFLKKRNFFGQILFFHYHELLNRCDLFSQWRGYIINKNYVILKRNENIWLSMGEICFGHSNKSSWPKNKRRNNFLLRKYVLFKNSSPNFAMKLQNRILLFCDFEGAPIP